MDSFFIGREREQKYLEEYLNSEQSEFIAVYGRRRVGKTFLIKHIIGESASYYVVGMHNVPKKLQLENFIQPMRQNGFKQRKPTNWLQAFTQLEQYLESLTKGRKIVFIDEMLWMDTLHSHFISGLEHFWNSWAANRNDIKLIVCGSATSWIINNIIKNKGGLHNRVTHTIPLAPFTLKECKEYFDRKGYNLQSRQIKECYMIYGGVPFYLSKIKKSESIAQSVDRLIFAEDGELHNEFQSVYESLYANASDHIKVVSVLAAKCKGLTRQEINDGTKLSNNGNLTTVLEELEQCGFIRSYEPFVAESKSRRRKSVNSHRSPFCLYQYRKAQIDMLINRADECINLCEMKYYNDVLRMTQQNEDDIRRKINVFYEQTGTHKQIIVTMITAHGLEHNAHSGCVQQELTLEDIIKI